MAYHTIPYEAGVTAYAEVSSGRPMRMLYEIKMITGNLSNC